MTAAIVVLSEFVAKRQLHGAAVRGPAGWELRARCGTAAEQAQEHVDFCFWQGASGERYIHHIYSLISCPALPEANYILLNIDESGHRTVLRVSRTEHEAASLNLAEIRHRGAKLGATEVHVHLIAEGEAERRVIEMDLAAGLMAEPDLRPLSA